MRYYDDELYHWGIKLGGKKKHHKYLYRIKVKGKYRYFYTEEEYQKFLHKGEKKAKEVKDKVEDKAKDTAKDVASKGKSIFDKLTSGLSDLFSKTPISHLDDDKTTTGMASVNKMASKLSASIKDVSDTVKAKGKMVADKILSKTPFGKKEKKQEPKKTDKKHKYIAKEKINGKWRYFYSEEEYLAWKKRGSYQKNEPSFMHSVREQKDPSDAATDESHINETWDPNVLDHSNNCINCTAAYELRRRGYDVEAAPDKDGEGYDRFDRWYKNPKIMMVRPALTSRGMEDNVRAMAKSYPPNSRGDISVSWKGGGGHSMVWETDSKGRLTIRDAQVNLVYCDHGKMLTTGKYSHKRLFQQTVNNQWGGVCMTRTDNLELKPGIRKAFREHDKESKRKYVIPQGR